MLNTGHRHPRVVGAVREQLDRLMHTCFQVTMYEPYVELAARLCPLLAAATAGATRRCSSRPAPKAIENAVKIARAHTNRSGGRRVQRRVPRPHAARADDDRVEPGVPAELRPVRAPTSTTRRFRTSTAAGPRTARFDALEHLFAREVTPASGRGRHHRAGARRRRLRAGAAGVPAAAPRAHDAARHRAGRRRSAERLRADRQDVRLSARRHRAGSRR